MSHVAEELASLFEEKAAQLDGVTPDPLAAVQRRAAVRRRRRQAVTVAGAAVVAAAAVLGTAAVRHTTASPAVGTTTPSPTPPSATAVPAAVLAAVDKAKAVGSIDAPVEWIATTSQRAATIDGATAGAPDQPIYLVQIRGHFAPVVPLPYVAAKRSTGPTGTVWLATIPIGATATSWGGGLTLGNTAVDLSRYGTVHTFAGATPTATPGTCSGLAITVEPAATGAASPQAAIQAFLRSGTATFSLPQHGWASTDGVRYTSGTAVIEITRLPGGSFVVTAASGC